MSTDFFPLSGSSPAEVPLKNAPLVRVIAQVRFTPILAIAQQATVATFQEKIRQIYPILEEEAVHHVLVPTAGGEPSIKKETIWRFYDHDKNWRVSLNSGFIAVETKSYKSRKDFLDRLELILTSMEEVFNPADVLRMGIRYIDRIEGDAVEQIASMVKPEVLGIVAADISKTSKHILTEALFTADEGEITARWGRLQPDATYDPDALDPIKGSSWILDLDMSITKTQPFKAASLTETSSLFSHRIYSLFRWMVTDNFLKFYGGTV